MRVLSECLCRGVGRGAVLCVQMASSDELLLVSHTDFAWPGQPGIQTAPKVSFLHFCFQLTSNVDQFSCEKSIIKVTIRLSKLAKKMFDISCRKNKNTQKFEPFKVRTENALPLRARSKE